VLIEVRELRKTLGGRLVLDGVSLAVPRGQTVAVMGPSGAGKTTLLRCLNGLERADAGTVRVGEHELGPGTAAGAGAGAGASDGQRDATLLALRRRVGFVFQQWHLFANRTVLGNVVEAPIHVAHKPAAEAAARAEALLDRVGIAHRAGAYPHELSGGEQQRAAIARALAMDPEVLLLDEPTSSLDRARAEELTSLLRDLAADGLTLVAVTHDQRVAAALGARIVALESGRIVRDDR
jgi:polar amino acid transport system ATP-binding protein